MKATFNNSSSRKFRLFFLALAIGTLLGFAYAAPSPSRAEGWGTAPPFSQGAVTSPLQRGDMMPAVDSPARVWDIAEDFRASPGQSNPNPDRYGNANVWNFMQSPAFLHSNYSHVTQFFTDVAGTPGLQGWVGRQPTGFVNDFVPSFVKNTNAYDVVPNALIPAGAFVMHPPKRAMAVLGWRSPIAGTVKIEGGVTDLNSNCGDGIVWFVDGHRIPTAQGAIPNGGAQAFADGTGGAKLAQLHVDKGESLKLLIHPGGDYFCDTTRVDLTITELDVTPPGVTLTGTGTDGAGQQYLELTARDRGFGIAKIEVLRSQNANTVIPPFTIGTTQPVIIRATKIDPTKQAIVVVRVTDVAGNFRVGDPVLQVLRVETGKRVRETFENIPPEEHFISVVNGTPGLKRLRISVNDTLFGTVELAIGETKSVDISAAMGSDANKVTLVGKGKQGSEAVVVIGDSEIDGGLLEGLVRARLASPAENFGWGK